MNVELGKTLFITGTSCIIALRASSTLINVAKRTFKMSRGQDITDRLFARIITASDVEQP